jgi:hypothetical protein
MRDYMDTDTQARARSAGTADKNPANPVAASTDSPAGRSNGSRQHVDHLSAVADTTVSRDADRRSSAEAVAPFKKGVAREYFESAVVTFVMALFGMTFIV